MNLRATIVLFGILGVFLAAFAALQLYDVRTQEQRGEAEKWLLPTLKAANVSPRDFASVVVERTGEKAERLEFTKKDGEWRMVAPKDVRADGAAVDRLIDQLVRAERPTQLEPPSTNLADYGLEHPAVKVTLTLEDKKAEEIKAPSKTFTFSLGQPSTVKKDTLVYAITSESGKAPVAIARTRIDRPFAPLDDYRSKELIGSTFNVDHVKLAGAKRPTLDLLKVDGKDWVFQEPKLGDADSGQVNDLTSALGTIRVERNEDFVADGKLDPAKLDTYGLTPEKAAYVLTVRHKDAKEKTETLLVGHKDPEATRKAGDVNQATQALLAALAGPLGATVVAPLTAGEATNHQLGQDGYYFAMLAEDNAVVRIPGKHLKSFEKKADDLRSKTLARVDGQKVDAINVVSGGETVRLRRPKLKGDSASFAAPSEWVVWSDRHDKEVKAHLDVVTKLIDALNKISLPDARHFLDDDPRQRAWFGTDPIDLGLDKPSAEIIVWQEGIKRDKDGKPEGAGEPALKDEIKDKPFLRLTLGQKDPKRNVTYVKRQRREEPPVVLAVPDPWMETPAASSSPGGLPPPRGERISLTERATAGYLGFRDHVLPSFNVDQATKLEYAHLGNVYEVERDAKPDASSSGFADWKLTKPVQGKCDNADLVMFQLSRLAADKLVTDKATEEDRKEKYGLAAPMLSMTVTTADKEKKTGTYKYVIGKKAPSGGPHADHYYARVEAKPADGAAPEANDFVFLLPKDLVGGLDVELRDTVIFPSETTLSGRKPEEVTFIWRDKDKKFQETRLELVREAGASGDKPTWSIKSLTVDGKDAKAELPKLDSAKVDQLLGLATTAGFGRGPRLNPLTTERFLAHDAKPLAKQRLDESNKDNPPALVVEIHYADKTTRKLIVGDRWAFVEDEYPGLRQKAYYHAAASTVPNAVFILGEADFKDLLAGVHYFKAEEKVAAP